MKKIPKRKTVSQLKKDADSVTSELVRRSAADWQGLVKCYTCPVKKHWKQMQCGHYESRMYNGTRYELKNLRPQCVACNIFKMGNKTIFALNLQKEEGQGILEELRAQAIKITQFTANQLEMFIVSLKDRLKKLN